MDYSQNFSASYQLPLNLIPIFDWINTDASYSATYNWQRGTDLEDGTSLGNNISNNRQFNLNGSFSLEKLYNHIPFLKKTNERFNKNPQRNNSSRNNRNTNAQNNSKDQGKQNDKEQAVWFIGLWTKAYEEALDGIGFHSFDETFKKVYKTYWEMI